MAARWYWTNGDGDDEEITDRVDRMNPWELTEKAEEGAMGTSTVVFADPDMDLDMKGWRPIWVIEDTSEITDNVLWAGTTGEQVISHGDGDNFDPLGRTWSVSLWDKNNFWQRRLMMGADAKRPAETDVERMQWLLTTSEADAITDASTWLSVLNPVNMDKADLRRQYLNQIVDDAAQASNKNWYLTQIETGSGRANAGWYASLASTARTSPLSLSNDPADWSDDALLDGTSLVWPISGDTKLTRDPSRVYSGVNVEYEKGSVFRNDGTTATAFTRRDFVAPSGNVKTKAKAVARAIRYLDDLDTQDERITTTVEVPASKATMLRAGRRVAFKATHLPGYSTGFTYLRILSCTIRPAAAGTKYRMTLEMGTTNMEASFSGACAAIGVSLTEAGTYGGNGSATTQAPGNLFYVKAGSPAPWPTVPTTGHVGGWNFPDYANDAAGDNAGNTAYVVVAGPGTLTITVADYLGSAHSFDALVKYESGGIGLQHASLNLTGQSEGALVFEIPDDSHCFHWVEVGDDGSVGGGKWQFVSWDWVPA